MEFNRSTRCCIRRIYCRIFLSNASAIALSEQTITDLKALGFPNAGATILPPEIYSWDAVLSLKGIAILVIAGFLVGFGTRYAGGCTSGHGNYRIEQLTTSFFSRCHWFSLLAD